MKAKLDSSKPDLICKTCWKSCQAVWGDTWLKGNITKYCQVVLSVLSYKLLTARHMNESYSVCILADTYVWFLEKTMFVKIISVGHKPKQNENLT